MFKKKLINTLSALTAITMLASSIPAAFAYYEPASDVTEGLSSRELSKLTAEEGMVLLKNTNNALPLKNGESVAVFGINQVDYIHGGGGSGNFTSEYYVNLMEGLEKKKAEGKIDLYEDLYSMYKSVYDNYWKNDGRTYAYGSKQGAVIMYQGETSITQAQADAAAQEADTAVITIGRPAGESGDRKSGKGDFLLSDKETDMIDKVKNAGFKKIIAVLNVAGITDTNWLKDGIDAALLVYFPGMEGGNAIADVLCGDAYPSGKLVDTWAQNYSDYPSSSNFGNSSYTKYEEDIFVGYRYFETIPGADEKVNYEFGYGLSYADFSIDNVSFSYDAENITVDADITNVSGQYSGKEVLQVYYRAPEVALTQPARELAAFEKTSELQPGEVQHMSLSFPITDMASYDDTGKTGHEAAYVLEKGEYEIYVGSSVRSCVLAGAYTVAETIVTEQLSHRLVPDTSLLTRRLTSSGEYELLTQTTAAEKTPEKAESDYASPPRSDDKFITFNEVVKDNSLLQTFVSRLNDEELIKLVGCTTPAAGQRTGIGGLEVYGVPVIGTANGPAGIQYNGGSQTDPERNTTFFPCATMQASTWNTKLIETLGKAIALEAKHFGMSLWQAPGMNIHRDPLCGRSFEYFSEDPYLTGKIGAAITVGVQSQDFASQPKHFALNNQETGRIGNDSRISERALREIYLKGFEITVKESQPWSIMSSYNKINGTYASANYELLTEILREEWGFEGFVMTDFSTGASHLNELLAGGDLRAPATAPNPSQLRTALSNGTLARWQLQRSAENILRFILKTRDAKVLADEPFNYSIALSFNGGTTVSDDKIYIFDSSTVYNFMKSINDTYNQKYELLSADGTILASYNMNGDDEIICGNELDFVKIGTTLRVASEDNSVSKVYTVSSPSLALNRTVRASATESSNTAAKAVDGDTSTRWSAYINEQKTNGVYDNFGNWLEIDLGAVYNLSSISLLFYSDSSRSYTYEIWGKATDAPWDADVSRDKDLALQGYELISPSQTSVMDAEADITAFDSASARYIVIKTTDGVNGKAPTICEAEIFGWRLSSDVYTINEAEHIIYMPEDTLLSEASENLTLTGNASMTIEPNAAWVGDFIAVANEYGDEIIYSVRQGNVQLPELISDYTLYDDGSIEDTELRATGTGLPYPAAAARYAVVKFDISGLTATEELLSARLSLYMSTKGNKGNPVFTVYTSEESDNPGPDIMIAQYQSDFSQNDATTSYGTLNVDKWFTFDVGTAISKAVREGKKVISFVVSADTCANNFAISALGADTAARLYVTTSEELLSATASYEDGCIKVTVTNTTAQDYGGVLIYAAVYNSVGELIDVKTKETELEPGILDKEIIFEEVASDGNSIKVFVWNEALSPILEAIAIE